MNLFNVKKGQFVYFKNTLHKVYSVNPFFKKSIYIIDLEDFKQQLVKAKDIDLYKPKHLDSFICNHKRYTLHKDVKAKIGDYILIINPKPDSIDNHHLNAIEMVSAIEVNGVVSNKSNGIKHSEYWVMVPGLETGATIIDQQLPGPLTTNEQTSNSTETETISEVIKEPRLGDIYRKSDSEPPMQVMIIAVKGQTIYLGGGLKVTIEELSDTNKWSFVLNILEQ